VNLQLLIDSIVRQTTVLIAQLATAGGVRAPLSHVANQVFLDLAEELYAQGVSRKVSADMFGLALRTYLRKIQRLSESSTERGRSLWDAVLAYLGTGRVVTRAEVLQRFHRDDSEMVRGVLHDLCESGLLFRMGSGIRTAYRVVTQEELGSLREGADQDGTDELIWVLIYREGPFTFEALDKRTCVRDLRGMLDRLMARGRIRRSENDGEPIYSASEFFVPVNAAVGWEAAVFDHYQALVKTITARLTREAPESRGDEIGGSTYTFEVWPGHPMEAEVLGQLERLRQATSDLRSRVRAYNAKHPRPTAFAQVTFYGGQCTTHHLEERKDEHA